MASETAYLSLGSNSGDRFGYLVSGLEGLRQDPRILVERVSSFYETEPQDVVDQSWFLNMAAVIRTDLAPLDLLRVLQRLEQGAGRYRVEGGRRGPRTLDLDILLYGSMVMESPELTIPHPRMMERRFVLEPLVEIASDLVYPGRTDTFVSYLNGVSSQAVRLVNLPL